MSDQGGLLIDIGGRSLHARVRGSGPTVVLNGGGGKPGVDEYPEIEAQLVKFATVVTYDRPGIGQSPPASVYQSAAEMAADLNSLLRRLPLSMPALLLGYSFSGLLVQLYACEYPRDVSALLLLDPTPDALFAGFHSMGADLRNSMRAAMLQQLRASNATEGLLRDMYCMPESCEQVYRAVEEDHRMPDIPVVLITACDPSTLSSKPGQHQMGQSHKRIAERVPRGRHLFASNRSHVSLVREEHPLIVDTIRSLLSQ